METVNIQIKYMVSLREQTGHRQEYVSFPQGSTLREVAEWLKSRYAFSLPDPHIMAILNGRGWQQLPLKMATEIQDGDLICLFPPISGG